MCSVELSMKKFYNLKARCSNYFLILSFVCIFHLYKGAPRKGVKVFYICDFPLRLKSIKATIQAEESEMSVKAMKKAQIKAGQLYRTRRLGRLKYPFERF